MKKLKSYTIILILLFTTSYFTFDAYVDPGTGILFIQAIIGVLIGSSIIVKIYWYKLKEKFLNIILTKSNHGFLEIINILPDDSLN